MSVNVRPRSEQAPLLIEQEEYDRLVRRTGRGWSHCDDRSEWLAKLHYLRAGLTSGKLDRAQFEERESRLVLAWLARMC